MRLTNFLEAGSTLYGFRAISRDDTIALFSETLASRGLIQNESAVSTGLTRTEDVHTTVIGNGVAILRAGAKIVACGTMVRIAHPGFDTPRLLGLGLIPQGGVSLAMALSAYLTFYEVKVEGVDAGQTLFSVVVLGLVLSKLVGPVFTTKTLRRAGEISSRVEEALSEGHDQLARTQAARHTPGADLDSDLEL